MTESIGVVEVVWVSCVTCGGQGFVLVPVEGLFGRLPCPTCVGVGGVPRRNDGKRGWDGFSRVSGSDLTTDLGSDDGGPQNGGEGL